MGNLSRRGLGGIVRICRFIVYVWLHGGIKASFDRVAELAAGVLAARG